MSGFEFGSDFNTELENVNLQISWPIDPLFFGTGREALFALLVTKFRNNVWKRLWIPSYYCSSVVDRIKHIGLTLVFYCDNPILDDEEIIPMLEFCEGDVLLRVNYFGLRKFKDNTQINIPVIEDHTHALFGSWATKSNANWCFASIRKELPVPDGGILWSPTGCKLAENPTANVLHENICEKRFEAMQLKNEYLFKGGHFAIKDRYLKLFGETEAEIGNYESCSVISHFSLDALKKVPKNWLNRKADNYHYLLANLDLPTGVIIKAETGIIPFAIILCFETEVLRNSVRSHLIKNHVYPAILWPVANFMNQEDIHFSDTMLVIHCDGRYSLGDIRELKDRIEKSVKI